MSKLEELRNTIAKMFENAKEKEQIEQLARVNNSIAEVEQEQKQLIEKNAELIKSYKELVKHTSFKEQPQETATQTIGDVPSLEDALKVFLASKNNKE